jgi:hypothetical protein
MAIWRQLCRQPDRIYEFVKRDRLDQQGLDDQRHRRTRRVCHHSGLVAVGQGCEALSGYRRAGAGCSRTPQFGQLIV